MLKCILLSPVPFPLFIILTSIMPNGAIGSHDRVFFRILLIHHINEAWLLLLIGYFLSIISKLLREHLHYNTLHKICKMDQPR